MADKQRQMMDRFKALPENGQRYVLAAFAVADDVDRYIDGDDPVEIVFQQLLDGQQSGQVEHELYRTEMICSLVGNSSSLGTGSADSTGSAGTTNSIGASAAGTGSTGTTGTAAGGGGQSAQS